VLAVTFPSQEIEECGERAVWQDVHQRLINKH
jgi:hypothetical protein